MTGTADMCSCRRYQWSLGRAWAAADLPHGQERVAWIMLNPSIGDADEDDPTIRRCIRFSCEWGYGSLILVNLFAYQTAVPRKLREARYPVGDRNNEAILNAVRGSALVVAGWGAEGHRPGVRDRAWEVFDMLSRPPNGIAIVCLGLTRKGAPRHPVRIRGNTQRQPFQMVRPGGGSEAAEG